jgi:hypothetical protein
MSVRSFAVGRRFHPATKPAAGQKATLQHEPENARDPNALMVVSVCKSADILGYIPATVSALLAPLLLSEQVTVEVTVSEPPKTPKASLPIIIKVFSLCPH